MGRKSLGIVGALLALSAVLRPLAPADEKSQRSLTQVREIEQAGAAAEILEEGPWKALCDSLFIRGIAKTQQSSRGATAGMPGANASHWGCASSMAHDVRFLIATVADPKKTNLQLFYDRSIESLVWAASDSGFSFERYWLPWSNVAETELPRIADRRIRKLELERLAEQPGLIIFRHRARGSQAEGPDCGPVSSTAPLLLFLVGETPTSGINKKAFGNALAYIAEIARLAHASVPWIRVIGPTFSGSLEPLALDLDTLLHKFSNLRMHFITGTATNADALNDFKRRLTRLMASPGERIRYETVLENDSKASALFLKYLQDSGKKPDRVAVLAEDETEYGSLIPSFYDGNTREEQWLLVRYPRQIARLRNAYQEVDSAETRELGRAEGVKFTLKDFPEDDPRSAGKDGAPDFSKVQGPVSQQTVLSGISSTLRRERADYVGIIATDVLDSLFLARHLRVSATDTRVFMFDADLLFVGETETAPLEGLLVITTYPLFARNQHWTGARIKPGVGRRVHFSSRAAEGTYNACRALLQDNEPWDDTKRGCLLDYSYPTKDAGQDGPPLWLTVLGRDGYWPVALLNQGRSSSGTAEAPTPFWHGPMGTSQTPNRAGRADRSPAPRDLHPELPSRGWYLLFWAVMVFAAAHCLYVLYLLSLVPETAGAVSQTQQNPWQVRLANRVHRVAQSRLKLWHRTRGVLRLLVQSVGALEAIFPVYKDSTRQHRYGHKLPFLMAVTLTFLAVVGLLILTLDAYRFTAANMVTAGYETWQRAYSVIARICFLLLAATSFAIFLRSLAEPVMSRRFRDKKTLSSFREYWPVMLLIIAVPLACLLVFAHLVLSQNLTAGFFFAYRSLMLTSGISPLTPLLILAVAYYYWAWVHLRREDMIARRDFFKTFLQSVQATPDAPRYMNRVDGTVDNIFSFHVWRPALLFMFLWVLVFQPWRTLQSIEPALYDYLCIFAFAVLYWALALCWTQFIWIWHDFRNLLQWLERNPVRNAFSRLRKQITWLPLVSGLPEHQYYITYRCRDTLTALQNFDIDTLSGKHKDTLVHLKQELDEECRNGVHADTLHEELGQTAADCQRVDVTTYARLQSELDKLADIIVSQLKAHQWRAGDSDSLRREREDETVKVMTAEAQLLVLEEEFVALRYLVYMRYIFRHLRNLLGFVVIGFIVSAISLQSYVFRAHHWIGFSCLCTFVALGAGVGIVFAAMDRDPILSRITETKSNELGKTFVYRMLQFGTLPLITVLAGEFPFIGRIFLSWVRPVLDVLH